MQTALLKLPETGEIPCEIRNFCPAGLFLKLMRQGDLNGVPPQKEGAEVVFISYKAGSMFRMNGRLSHISAIGAGFVFDQAPSVQVMQSLQEAALSDPFEEKVIPEAHAQMLEQCVDTFAKFLQPLHSFMTKAVDLELTLEENSIQPEGISLSTQYESKGKRFVDSYCEDVLEQARTFAVPDLGMQLESEALENLSQLRQREVKDWLSLVDNVLMLEDKFDNYLKALEPRLSILAQRNIKSFENPFGPSVLMNTFHYSSKELDLIQERRESLYQSVGNQLLETLEGFYKEIIELTAPLDLPPPVPINPFLGDKELMDFSQLASLAKPPIRELPKAEQEGETPGLLTAKPPVSVVASRPRPRRMEMPPHQPDVFTAFVVLSRYADGRANKNAFNSELYLDRFAVIDALEVVQKANQSKESPFLSAPKMQAELKKALEAVNLESAYDHPEVRQNLQILGLLLDAMLADLSTPACITSYIVQLQFPLLMVAFADPGLLHGETHPARGFLNQLDFLNLATNNQGELDNPLLVEKLDSLFVRIKKEAVTNVNTFYDALESLEKLTAPLLKAYSSRLERLAESCEGGQKLEHTRLVVDQEIDSRIGGKKIANIVPEMLDAGWRQLLVLTKLRQGNSNQDWNRQLYAIELLTSWLGTDNPDNPPTPAKIKELKYFIQEGLSSVNPELVEVNQILQKIEVLLPESGTLAQPPQFVDIPHADTTRQDQENALRYRLAGFQLGDWLRFSSAQSGWVPLRLSWIGQEPGRYVFTNRKGIKTLELDPVKFAQLLDEKRASRIDSLDEMPFVERISKTLLTTLRDRLR